MRVRTTEVLRERVRRAASLSGQSVSAFARDAIMRVNVPYESGPYNYVDTSINLSPREIEHIDRLAKAMHIPRNAAINLILYIASKESGDSYESSDDSRREP